MKIEKTPIEDLVILTPNIFGDHRGFFLETYNQQVMESLGLNYNFVQDNRSFSKRGTLRGLHFQKDEFAQAKLVTCLAGEVLDVAVDLREGSKTFGQHYSILLTGENKKQFLVPRGFAHGFAVLSETADFSYKCDNFYSPENESGIMYNDLELGIDWKLSEDEMILSEKDTKNLSLKEYRESYENSGDRGQWSAW